MWPDTDAQTNRQTHSENFHAHMKKIDGAPITNFAAMLFRRLNHQQSLYALMAAAVMVDGRRAAQETIELDALTGRAKSLRTLKSGPRNQMRAKVDHRLHGKEFFILVKQAAEKLSKSKDWSLSAFAHVADIIFADSELLPSESAFLATVARKLNVPAETVVKIVTQLQIKNEHGGFAAADKTQFLASVAMTDEAKERQAILANAASDLVGMTPQESMLTIILAAAMADHHRHQDERIEIDALMNRSRCLLALNVQERDALRHKVNPQLGRQHISKQLEIACQFLPESLRLPAYAHAVDITYADGKVMPEERQFLNNLAIALQLNPTAVSAMNDVLDLKNKK